MAFTLIETSLYYGSCFSPAAFAGVSPLMQLCRLHIRKTVGKRRLGGIDDLHLPADIKQYLLYRSNPGGDQMHWEDCQWLILSISLVRQQGVYLHSCGGEKAVGRLRIVINCNSTLWQTSVNKLILKMNIDVYVKTLKSWSKVLPLNVHK